MLLVYLLSGLKNIERLEVINETHYVFSYIQWVTIRLNFDIK